MIGVGYSNTDYTDLWEWLGWVADFSRTDYTDSVQGDKTQVIRWLHLWNVFVNWRRIGYNKYLIILNLGELTLL